MNGKRQAVLCVLLSVMIGTCMFMLSNPVVATGEERTGNYIVLDISQYREGELIHREVIEDDYILRNWGYMWLHIMSGDRYSDVFANYKFRDVNNIEHGFHNAELFFTRQNAEIQLGTGNTPVAVTDYDLNTEVLQMVVDDGHVWVNGNEFNVTFDSTLVSDGSYSLQEAGITATISASTGSAYQTMMARDVFSPISVVNADVIIVRYIFRFNVGA